MSKNMPTFDVVMEPRKITNGKIKELKSLNIKKNRDELSLFLVEGIKAVVDTMKGFHLVELVCSPEWFEKNLKLIKDFEDKVTLDPGKKGISRISDFSSSPDVIGVFKLPQRLKEIPVLEPDKFYVLLDGVQDPGNLGTIIRTCDWFGIYDIFASYHTVDVFNPKVVRSTMGSICRVKVHYTDLLQLVKKNCNIPLVGTVLDGNPIQDCIISSPAFLLMGNEGKGISESLRNRIDIPVTIPPANVISHPDSLNVAVAAAIIMAHIKL